MMKPVMGNTKDCLIVADWRSWPHLMLRFSHPPAKFRESDAPTDHRGLAPGGLIRHAEEIQPSHKCPLFLRCVTNLGSLPCIVPSIGAMCCLSSCHAVGRVCLPAQRDSLRGRESNPLPPGYEPGMQPLHFPTFRQRKAAAPRRAASQYAMKLFARLPIPPAASCQPMHLHCSRRNQVCAQFSGRS